HAQETPHWPLFEKAYRKFAKVFLSRSGGFRRSKSYLQSDPDAAIGTGSTAFGPVFSADNRDRRLSLAMEVTADKQSRSASFTQSTPGGDASRDRRIRRLRGLATLMDTAFTVPVTSIRFGLDGLL